jgi:hypothetical protein
MSDIKLIKNLFSGKKSLLILLLDVMELLLFLIELNNVVEVSSFLFENRFVTYSSNKLV